MSAAWGPASERAPGWGGISSGSPIARSLLRRCLRPVPAAADHEAAGTQIRAADRYLPASGSELEGLRGPQEGPGPPTPAARAESWGAVVSRGFAPRVPVAGRPERFPTHRRAELLSWSPKESSELSPPARARAARFPQNPSLRASLAEKFLALARSGDPNRGIPSVGVPRWVAEQMPLLHLPIAIQSEEAKG